MDTLCLLGNSACNGVVIVEPALDCIRPEDLQPLLKPAESTSPGEQQTRYLYRAQHGIPQFEYREHVETAGKVSDALQPVT